MLAQSQVPMTLGETMPETLTLKNDKMIELSLEDAVLHALEHNVGIVVERYKRSRSLLGVEEAYGIYDFNFGADAIAASSARASVSTLDGTPVLETDSEDLNFNLSRLLPWGGTARARFTNGRDESSSPNDVPNPRYQSALNFSYVQPLLREYGRDVTEHRIRLAHNANASNFEAFRAEVIGIVQQVSDGYWSLVEARQQLKVAEESLRLAEELHRMNKIQVDVGTKAPLDLVQSEVGVATRQEDIVRRRAAVEDAEDQLRRLFNLAQGSQWDIDLVPTTEAEIVHRVIDLGQAVKTAFDKRADLKQLEIENLRRDLEAKLAKNATKPRLDLTASYGLSGIGGLVRNPGTGQIDLDTDLVDAHEQIVDREFDGWQIELNFAYPLENRAARARALEAGLFVEQGARELQDGRDQAMLEVRRTARAVETAAQAIELAKASSRLARRNLEAEQKRYENGLSTSFQVLEIQEDLSQALSREVGAVTSYRRALTAFYRATGELLEQAKVVLVDGGGDK